MSNNKKEAEEKPIEEAKKEAEEKPIEEAKKEAEVSKPKDLYIMSITAKGRSGKLYKENDKISEDVAKAEGLSGCIVKG